MPVNCCAACLLLTTTGRVLVQWELDATLPLRYPQLALLVASLVQFSKMQSFAELALSNGLTLVVRSDAAAQLSCVVVCKTGDVGDAQRCKKALDMAHLKSLVILTEFLRCYRGDVEALVEESRTSAEDMAERYTLSSALEGGGGSGHHHRDNNNSSSSRLRDDAADDGTLDAFVEFQNEFIAPIIEDDSAENIRAGVSDSVTKATMASVEITRQFLLNANTGCVLYSLMAAPKVQVRRRYTEESLLTQQLLARLARALSASFPILHSTALLQRNRCDSHVGFASNGVSSTTVVLRIPPVCPQDTAAASSTTTATTAAPSCLHIAVQMLSIGTFASVVFFYGVSDRSLGHTNELVRSGDLQRVLLADPRGSLLLALVQEAAGATEFQLHVGSDGAPECVLKALENLAAPWTKLFEPV